MSIVVRPKQSVKFFVFAALILALFSIVGQVYRYFFNSEKFSRLIIFFNIGLENNIPSLYSALLLLFCSMLLTLVALVKQQYRDRFTIHWWSLSVFFLYLTLDESLDIHEPFMRHLSQLGLLGIFNGAFLLFFALAYAKLFLRLPLKLQCLVLLSGSIFAFGVIGIEQIGERYFPSIYQQPLFIAELITTLEELLETAGVTIFLYALLWYIKSVLGGINISIGKPVTQISQQLDDQQNGEVSANEYIV